MAKIIALDGARAMGKSTIARRIRETTFGGTLINLTGFKDAGEEGRIKAYRYHRGILRMMNRAPEDVLFILDRTFISEYVYAAIYKDYDFAVEFVELTEMLLHPDNEIHLFHPYMFPSRYEIEERLNREKATLFGKVTDTPEEIIRQMEMYKKAMDSFRYMCRGKDNIRINYVDTTRMTLGGVYDHVRNLCPPELFK